MPTIPAADPPAASDASPAWIAPRSARTLVLLAATTIGLYLCFLLALPFVPALAWALAFAVLFSPLQGWLERRIRQPSLAATACLLVVLSIVVVPAVLVGQQLVLQVANGAQLIDHEVSGNDWRGRLSQIPRLAPVLETIEREFNVPEAVKSIAAWLSGTAATLVTGSVLQLVAVALTFYLLFFFLRDRAAALRAIRALSPLTDAQTNAIVARVRDTIFATIYGTLAVSSVQGVLGGLMFWALGLPAPLLWGVVMALLGIVPVLGAFVVWIPAALFLLLQGRWIAALVLTAWGVLVVGTIDNLLRPVLVGNRLQQHTVLAFLSVVGGLLMFGSSGLILGPVIMTITLGLLEVWSLRGKAEARSTVSTPADLAAGTGATHTHP
ncbi:MAG: AI-2E family transporter [Arenimonas sp.]